MKFKRVFLVIVDSCGFGSAKDSYKFNDEGAVNWDYNKLYQRVIDEKFGDEARDWFFEPDEDVLPIPAREDTNNIILEWLIEKNILKK